MDECCVKAPEAGICKQAQENGDIINSISERIDNLLITLVGSNNEKECCNVKAPADCLKNEIKIQYAVLKHISETIENIACTLNQ